MPSTPRGSIWNFRGRHGQAEEKTSDRTNAGTSGSPIAIKGITMPPRKYKKRLVLSQTFVIDADVNKKSQRSETAYVTLLILLVPFHNATFLGFSIMTSSIIRPQPFISS